MTDLSRTLLLGLNTLLILADAAIGYHLAPLLVSSWSDDTDGEGAVRQLRGLLSVVVALYMFFTCRAYANGQDILLAVLTCVVLLDMAVQLILRARLRSGPDR